MLNPCGTNTVLGRWRVLEGGETCMSERHIQKHWEHANFPPNKILARLETNTGTWWAVKSQLKTRTYGIFNQVNVWPVRQQQWAGNMQMRKEVQTEEWPPAVELGTVKQGLQKRWYTWQSECTNVIQDRWSQCYRAAVRHLTKLRFLPLRFVKFSLVAVHGKKCTKSTFLRKDKGMYSSSI